MSDASEKFVCERCGHDTCDITNFRRHLTRKNVCKPKILNISIETLRNKYLPPKKSKDVPCPSCEKMFSSTSSMNFHKKKCVSAQDNQTKQLLNEMIKKYNAQQEVLNYLLERTQTMTSSQSTPSSNITINNIQNQNIYNIVYNNYGQEDLSYITDNHELLSHCIYNPRSGMKQLIESIHFNPEHPENHSLRNRSLKQKIFEKRVDNHWVPCDISNTLDELIKKGYRVLNTYYNENVVNDPDIFEDELKFEALQKFHFLSDTTSKDYFSVKRDLKLLVVDKTMYLLEGNVQEDV